MNRHPPPPEPIPFTLEPRSPVAQDLHLIEQHEPTTMGACGRLGTCPHAVPEAWQGGRRAVTRRIQTSSTGLPGEIEQECGFSHLARPGQKLDSSRRRFGETLQKETAAVLVVREKIIPE